MRRNKDLIADQCIRQKQTKRRKRIAKTEETESFEDKW